MTLMTNDTHDTISRQIEVKYVYNTKVWDMSLKYVRGNQNFQGLKV